MNQGDAVEEPLVHIDGFRMDFGDESVIRDLSFDVREGETFGLLGSNGCGKTTTLRALLGSTSPPQAPSTSGGRSSSPATEPGSATCPKNAVCTRKSPSWTSWCTSDGSRA